MATFSEQMQAVADNVSSSKKKRSAAVTEMKEQAERLLADARTFVKTLAEGQRTVAADSRRQRANDRHDRSRQVRALRTSMHREFDETRDRLGKLLDRCRHERQKKVSQLLRCFHDAQQELQQDFRKAAQAWHSLQLRF